MNPKKELPWSLFLFLCLSWDLTQQPSGFKVCCFEVLGRKAIRHKEFGLLSASGSQWLNKTRTIDKNLSTLLRFFDVVTARSRRYIPSRTLLHLFLTRTIVTIAFPNVNKPYAQHLFSNRNRQLEEGLQSEFAIRLLNRHLSHTDPAVTTYSRQSTKLASVTSYPLVCFSPVDRPAGWGW